MSGLFGGNKQSSKSKTSDLQAPEYKALRPQVAGNVGSVVGGLVGSVPTSGPDLSPGATAQYAAPLTGQQTGLINQAVGSVQPGGNPLIDAANGMVGKTLAGDYLTPQSNPFLQATINTAQQPLIDQFSRQIVPQLLARFTAAGQNVNGAGSSAFANAANNSANDYEHNLGAIASDIAGKNYTAERGNQMTATNQANTLSNDSMTRLNSALQAASLPQMVQDLGIQRGLAEYNTRMTNVLQAIQLALNGTQPAMAGSSKSSGTTSPNIVGTIGSII